MGVQLRQLGRRDLRAARRVLGAAFVDYPSYVALFPGRWARRRLVARSMAATARDCLVLGTVTGAFVGDELAGIACWYRPGAFPVSLARDLLALPRLLPFLALQPTRLRRAVQAGRTLEANHPGGGAHWYLAAIAVAPSHRSAGLGTRLLATRHRELDREQRPAFLETADRRNVAWYERHGYVVRDQGPAFPGGPTQWYLWRDPRPPTH